ncbi:HAD family hydrolase [Dietzia cinnamea]|uniref:hypothetical protein n=1 Tax=Dietzia cinnamea TaxID=321318 RepID=UPI0001F64C71|nr:hypothetical protein [Dietzia cinnamea]EFV91800.1 hypothetical protein ES5_09153 [Dietzia cinnamea P4]MCT2057119.1 hypothetical protein [Dietzia cinnamea]
MDQHSPVGQQCVECLRAARVFFSAVVRRAGVGPEHIMYVPSLLDNDFLPARAVTGQDV